MENHVFEKRNSQFFLSLEMSRIKDVERKEKPNDVPKMFHQSKANHVEWI